MSVVQEMFSKKRILPLLLVVIMLAYWKYNQKNNHPMPLVTLSGATMGSIAYHIKYLDDEQRNYKSEIDSILVVFNQSLNHYDPNSELSRFNKDSTIIFNLPYFYPVLKRSKELYLATEGGFNPAVMPLVNAWGFGPEKGVVPDSVLIDSLLQIVDFGKVLYDTDKVWKIDKRVQLDFSAIAKGYAVDVVIEFLKSKNIHNAFVEIGGELRCAGKNDKDLDWKIGIIDPVSEIMNQSYIATVTLANKALATSANNFNYIEKDGKRYSHTLSPYTGYPATHSILSASVFSNNCMTADALATAFMATGIEKSKEILATMEGVDAFLVYSDENGSVNTFATEGIKPQVTLLEK